MGIVGSCSGRGRGWKELLYQKAIQRRLHGCHCSGQSPKSNQRKILNVPRRGGSYQKFPFSARDSGSMPRPQPFKARPSIPTRIHTHTYIYTGRSDRDTDIQQVFGPLSMHKFIIHVDHKQNSAASICEYKKEPWKLRPWRECVGVKPGMGKGEAGKGSEGWV